MMQLGFKFYPDTFLPEGEFDWVAQCAVGAFVGFQTFIVDQSNFSADVPILHFARSLRVAAWKFNQGVQSYTHYDVDSVWEIYFQKNNDMIEISDNLTPRIGKVLRSEFILTSEAYARDVYKTCCEMCPELKERVGEWWDFENEKLLPPH